MTSKRVISTYSQYIIPKQKGNKCVQLCNDHANSVVNNESTNINTTTATTTTTTTTTDNKNNNNNILTRITYYRTRQYVIRVSILF